MMSNAQQRPSPADLTVTQRALTQASRLYDFLLQQQSAGYGSRSHPSPSIQTLLAFLPAFAETDRITVTMDHVLSALTDQNRVHAELEMAQDALRGAITREQVAEARVRELEVEVDRLQADLRMFKHMLASADFMLDRTPPSNKPCVDPVHASHPVPYAGAPTVAASGTIADNENWRQDLGTEDACSTPSRKRNATKRASQFDPLDQQPRPVKQLRVGSSLMVANLANRTAVADELRSEHEWLMSTRDSTSTTESQVSGPFVPFTSPAKRSSGPPSRVASADASTHTRVAADLASYLLPRTYIPNHLLLDFSASYLPDAASRDLGLFPASHRCHMQPTSRYFLPDSRTLFAQRIRDAAQLKSKRQLEISDYVLEHGLDKLVGYLNVSDALKGTSLDCIHRVFGKLCNAPFVMVCEIEKAVVGPDVWDDIVAPELAVPELDEQVAECAKMVVMGKFVVRGTIAYFVQRFVFV